MHKLFAVAALASTGALIAATATHPTRLATAPAGNVGTLLQRHDLSAVLRTVTSAPTSSTYPMNGFFGVSRYRIEVVISRVQRDPQQPGRYRVWGKDRFKGRVTPFAGTVDFTQARQTAKESDSQSALYVATGTYNLQENTSNIAAGTFKGRVALDFMLDDRKPVLAEYGYTDEGATQKGQILYKGTWTNAAGQTKPAVWVADIWDYRGPEVFHDFIVGDRNQHFNPRYAKLGWNSYWQNDEWWTSSPQASAKTRP